MLDLVKDIILVKKFISLLLISVCLGDTLILKDKTVYTGKLIKCLNGDIIFKAIPSAKLSFNISDIQELKLSNGAKIFDNGILVSTDLKTFEKYNLPWAKSNELFSIQNMAISDANLKPVGHWLMYTTLVSASFFGQLLAIENNNMIEGHIFDNPMYLFGSVTSSILLPMFFLKKGDKVTYPESVINESERKEYETIYSNRLAKRRISYIVGGVPITSAIVGAGLWLLAQNLNDSLNNY